MFLTKPASRSPWVAPYDAEQVTVHADATIALPLLVSALAASAKDALAARTPITFDVSGPTLAVNGRPLPPARFEAR